jgi:hypothetical protein
LQALVIFELIEFYLMLKGFNMKKLLSIALLCSSLVNAGSVVDTCISAVKPAMGWAAVCTVPAACMVAKNAMCDSSCKRGPNDSVDADSKRNNEPNFMSKACDLATEGSTYAVVTRGLSHALTGKANLNMQDMVVDSAVNSSVLCLSNSVSKRAPKQVAKIVNQLTNTELGKFVFVNVCNTLLRSAWSVAMTSMQSPAAPVVAVKAPTPSAK